MNLFIGAISVRLSPNDNIISLTRNSLPVVPGVANYFGFGFTTRNSKTFYCRKQNSEWKIRPGNYEFSGVGCPQFRLWRGNFFNRDAGHRVPSRVCISSFLSHAVSNIDSYSNCSLGDSLAILSNLRCSVYVGVRVIVVFIDVDETINGERFATFSAVKSKIPALTAI